MLLHVSLEKSIQGQLCGDCPFDQRASKGIELFPLLCRESNIGPEARGAPLPPCAWVHARPVAADGLLSRSFATKHKMPW